MAFPKICVRLGIKCFPCINGYNATITSRQYLETQRGSVRCPRSHRKWVCHGPNRDGLAPKATRFPGQATEKKLEVLTGPERIVRVTHRGFVVAAYFEKWRKPGLVAHPARSHFPCGVAHTPAFVRGTSPPTWLPSRSCLLSAASRPRPGSEQ